jgi:hypothetical protein
MEAMIWWLGPGVGELGQYGGRRSVHIGKCRTLRVSNREFVRMAVAAMAKSAPSIG